MDRNALILSHLGLAGRLASIWTGRIPGLERDDLYQECVLALLTAADDWDGARLDFPAWGWLCMERHLGRILAAGDLVKVPLYLRPLVENARRMIVAGLDQSTAIAMLETTAERRELIAFALQARRPLGRIRDDE